MKNSITRTAAALALTFASAVGAVAAAGPAYASAVQAQGGVGGPATVQPSGRMSGDIQVEGRYTGDRSATGRMSGGLRSDGRGTPRVPDPKAPTARLSGLVLAPLPLGVSPALVP